MLKSFVINIAWLTDIDLFKTPCGISEEQYKMVADILGCKIDSTYFGAVVVD